MDFVNADYIQYIEVPCMEPFGVLEGKCIICTHMSAISPRRCWQSARPNYIDSSVVSKRVLSTARNIISSQRTYLLPENANMVICIKHFQINIDIKYFQYYVLCFRHLMILNIHM